MESRLRKDRDELYQELCARIIAETSAYLTECMRHPELAARIPMVPADSGRFPPSFAMSFWNSLLLD